MNSLLEQGKFKISNGAKDFACNINDEPKPRGTVKKIDTTCVIGVSNTLLYTIDTTNLKTTAFYIDRPNSNDETAPIGNHIAITHPSIFLQAIFISIQFQSRGTTRH